MNKTNIFSREEVSRLAYLIWEKDEAPASHQLQHDTPVVVETPAGPTQGKLHLDLDTNIFSLILTGSGMFAAAQKIDIKVTPKMAGMFTLMPDGTLRLSIKSTPTKPSSQR